MSELQTQPTKQSRVGKVPIALPKGVTVSVGPQGVEVKGPKGTLVKALPAQISVGTEDGHVTVKSSAPDADGRRLQGLGRALIAAMVKGASEGYAQVLELQGTGYRAELNGRTLTLALGFSHPCVHELPADITASIPAESKGQVINLASPDKASLGQFAATLRALRPAEPYAGKGVRYRGENIRRKAGKAGKGRK